MITNFKLFESSSIASDLIDYCSDDFIESWYDDHYDISVSEIVSMSTASNLLMFFDDEGYKNDFIRDYISGYEFSEIQEYDLKNYIENNLTNEKEEKILELYNSNNYSGDEDIVSDIDGIVSFVIPTQPNDKVTRSSKRQIIVTSNTGKIKKYKSPKDFTILVQDGEEVIAGEVLSTGKETEFSSYMLDELDEDGLREVIEDSNEEDECVEESINNWYDGQDGEDLLREFHNVDDMDASDLYDVISSYINDDKLVQDWKDNEDFTYKKECIEGDIYNNTEIQRHILEQNSDSAVQLAELWEETSSNETIGDERDFQKAYIEKYFEDNKDDDEDDDSDDNKEIKADALLYLSDNFGLDSDIEEEYHDYIWKVNSAKYNI